MIKLNVKQVRNELNGVVKEYQEKIAQAKQTLTLLDSYERTLPTSAKGKVKKATNGTLAVASLMEKPIGITSAIRLVAHPKEGKTIGQLIEATLAQNPVTKSTNPKANIAALVSFMLKRKELKRKKSTNGYLYFAKEKAEKSAKAA